MTKINQIKPDTPVVSSQNSQFAIVDHLEGPDTIKLKKDKSGQHHYIPMSWVTKVDDKVHVDRPTDQCQREWSSVAPQMTAPQTKPSTSEVRPGGLRASGK